MDRTRELLEQYWGYTGFRPLQEDAIRCVQENRDSLVVLPTGGGKSLCFQLPALVMEGMALVVSPLISLMKDQVDFLQSCGVEAGCIHSGLSGSERIDVHDAIREARLKILYVAPERLLTQDFGNYIRDLEVSFIAVDEAHCISHWGHDFRPAYRELTSLKELFPDKALHGYTATATQQVREDICAQLSLETPEVLVGDFDRPNLLYSAEPQRNSFDKIVAIIDRHKGESGIVYSISRKSVDTLADKLCDAGYAALPYHAGMNEVSRKTNQEAFAREESDIMVATVAFGMGIDKSNVRYVIHAGMPKSLEHYQQESGRAGRDGLEAECHLFYSKSDYVRWKRMLADLDDEAYAIAVAKLNDMSAYCAGARCRHRALVEYFGQAFGKEKCAACDICLNTARVIENSDVVAGNILATVDALGPIAGPTYTVEILLGSNETRILKRGHHELETWGALKVYRKQDIRDWVEQLVGQGYLLKEGEFNILRATEKAGLLVQGIEKPMLLEPEAKSPRSRKPILQKTWAGVDKDLFELLRQKRLGLAKSRSVAAFVIFGDRSLREMASKLPKDEMEFLRISGVGEKKCGEFGKDFLEIIREYTQNPTGPETEADTSVAHVPAKRSQAKTEAFTLFSEGWSVGDVASRLSRTKSTTTKYLSEYISDRQLDSAHPWVSDKALARVRAAVGVLGAGRIKSIHEHLDGDVSYEDIQVALACIRNIGGAG